VKYRQHSKNAVGARPVAPAATTGVALLKQRTAAYGLARYLAETAMARGAHHPQLAPFMQSRSWGGAFWWDTIRLGVRGHFSLARIAAWFAIITLGRRVWALHRTLKPGYRLAQMEFDNHMFALSPGMHPPQPQHVEKRTPARSWWTYFDGRMTADWSAKLTASTPAVVILVPSLNPAEMFAGLATALDIGIGLAQRGHNVRFVATDAPMINHAASQHFIRARGGPIERVELHCGITQGTIPFHPDDRIMATAWWTAHLAKSVLQNPKFRHRQFLYLIQDYEPCFYPWGTEYACARASYKFDHIPIFNSAPLRDYFKLRGYDVGHDPLCFHPAIDVDRYAAQIRPDKPKRKIAIYGRPEVSRNLFEMGIGALGHWIERDGITPDIAELVSVGMIHPDVELPNGIVLRSAGKLPWAEYPAFLATVDVGLALMCSPHPSHLPIELAAAGARVVTNGFDCKDLSLLSPMIISTELCEPDLVVGLSKAWSSKRQPTPIDLTLIGDPIDVMLDRLAALLDPAVQLAAE
ncbi:MAG: glycosyl transferase family 1, partial [Planktomarina sp.]